MPAIFISHSSLDREVSEDIKAAIERLGFERIFLDFDKTSGIGAGEQWEKRLYEELSRCHAVVLVLTPGWLASKWCFAELVHARALGKVILPVICQPLGENFVLPDVQAVDLLSLNKEGMARLEQRLLAIGNELARGFTFDPNRAPYPGIHAFEAEDAAIYFGRDEETRAVIERLEARRTQGGARFLAIIGASGAGKSSLLKAGVIPQLARQRARWIVLSPFRPEKAPLEAFAKSIAETAGEPHAWRGWRERLGGADPVRPIEGLLKDLRIGEARAATFLIPIDQFEEAFTIADATERDAFLRVLAALLEPAGNLPVIAVATGRADALEGLIETGELANVTETVSLLPMPLERLPRLVEGPAAVSALAVEPGLSQRIAGDVEQADALPLLAHTLRLLHVRCASQKRLTVEAYLSLGDPERRLNPVQNSVRLAADQAIAGARPAEGELIALRDTFVPHLVRVRLDDGNRVRRPARLADIPPGAERLVRALVEARLLTSRVEETSDGKRGVIIEVTHESLFRAWPALALWLDEEQTFLADIERVKGAHESWAQTPTDQRALALLHGLLLSRARDWLARFPRRFGGGEMTALRDFILRSAAADDAERARIRRLRRRMLQGSLGAAIIFGIAAIVAAWQYVEATGARRAADAERRRAEQSFAVALQAADDLVFKITRGLRRARGVRVENVRRLLETAQAAMDSLALAAPDDLRLQRTRAAMLSEFASTYAASGDISRALAVEQQSLALNRKLAAAETGNPESRRELSAGLMRVGDFHRDLGDRRRARAAYEEAAAVMENLALEHPGNDDFQSDLGLSLDRVGDAHFAAGERDAALKSYERALAIMRGLVAAKPANVRWRRDLAKVLISIGDLHLDAGEGVRALIRFSESLSIIRQLAIDEPGNTDRLRDVGVGLERVGDVHFAEAEWARALAAYEESLSIIRKLAESDAENVTWQNDVGTDLEKVGKTRLAMGDRDGALEALEESLAIIRRLSAADPGNVQWQADTSLRLERMGDFWLAADNGAEALTVLDEGVAIMRKLVESDPGNAVWQRDLGSRLTRVGDAYREVRDRPAAMTRYEESLRIRRALAQSDPGHVGLQVDLIAGLYSVGAVAGTAQARAVLREALDIAEALAREDKLAAAHRSWPARLADALSKLPADGN